MALVKLALKCMLASMDGMTTAAFRSLCFEYGADGATTEMIPAPGFAMAKRKRRGHILEALSLRRPEETWLAAQIIGGEPVMMAAAAKRLEDLNRFDAIEINMGCPARTVVSSGNGSVLLTKPALAESILRSVCEAVQIPVRLKLRLGWDDEHITAPQIAAIAQDAGCSALILHGRTRSQQYAGEVQIENMLRVREAVTIPVFANGAVVSAEDAAPFAKQTRTDGVVIGRAALKNPWIFDDIHALERGGTPRERDAVERIGLLIRFAERLCEQKPQHFAMQEMRKYCLWYLAGLTDAEKTFEQTKQADDLDSFRRIHEDYLNRLVQANDTAIHTELLPKSTLDTVQR